MSSFVMQPLLVVGQGDNGENSLLQSRQRWLDVSRLSRVTVNLEVFKIESTGVGPGIEIETAEEIGGTWVSTRSEVVNAGTYVNTLTRDVPEGERGHLGNFLRWRISNFDPGSGQENELSFRITIVANAEKK